MGRQPWRSAESNRTFAPGDDAVDIDLEDVFDDPDDDTLTYEAISSDPDRLTITLSSAEVTITPGSPGRVVVRLRAIDPDGLSVTDSFSVTVTAGNRDYDSDNDGLIDVANLAQLDALRYDLNGDGLVDGAIVDAVLHRLPHGRSGNGVSQRRRLHGLRTDGEPGLRHGRRWRCRLRRRLLERRRRLGSDR